MENYLDQVYAGVLGKTIGVYMGRPFEGRSRASIEEQFGEIDRYVASEAGVPLVVADDDISGTFTFIRSLVDSGLYAETPPEFFGDTWLNYLIEKRTVLWWGEFGCSTEHTAFLRLKQGVKAPLSGSIALNGRTVAEQIGAQIFIDAFGMVAPGNPELATRLAERAARVSHDGEAVHCAKVVAAMVSLAFVDKDIHSLLDKAVAFIPADSLVAQVHRDVRAWARADGDWRKTFSRIEEKYGYAKYGGGCHAIPNHAVMVMAWEYAGNDFFEAQKIVNTAGWDTDCNAANVGSVCAIVAGLDGICAKYDFRGPIADAMVVPTADGTLGLTDCLTVARMVARIGCHVSRLPFPPHLVPTHLHDFARPGALHGYTAVACDASVAWSPKDKGSALVSFRAAPNAPVVVRGLDERFTAADGAYRRVSTPVFYDGETITCRLACDALEGAVDTVEAVLALTAVSASGKVKKSFRSEPASLKAGGHATLSWKVRCNGLAVCGIAVRIDAGAPCSGAIRILSVDACGKAAIATSMPELAKTSVDALCGWIGTLGEFRGDSLVQNEGRGLLVSGNLRWRNGRAACRFILHSGDAVGLVLCYQGLRRHYLVTVGHGTLKVVRNNYGEETLFKALVPMAEDKAFTLDARYTDGTIYAFFDGVPVAAVADATFDRGGAGICLETGRAFLADDLRVSGTVPPSPDWQGK